MNAASRIKVIHYADPPEQDEKKALTLCGNRLPIKETTQDKKQVSCFLCFEKLEGERDG